MTEENGAWIMQGLDWNDAGCIHTDRKLIDLVNKIESPVPASQGTRYQETAIKGIRALEIVKHQMLYKRQQKQVECILYPCNNKNSIAERRGQNYGLQGL